MSEPDKVKVVLVGETGVGKTSIINQFAEGKFDPGTVTSITGQFSQKTLDFPDGKSLKFDLWDTAGQEKYRSMSKIYYRDANVVILVYDITNQKSFDELKEYWFKEIKQNGNEDVILAIAANKSDLFDEMKVTNEIGEAFAKEKNAIFQSTSAKNDKGIKTLFENIGNKILGSNKNPVGNGDNKVVNITGQNGEINKKKKCC